MSHLLKMGFIILISFFVKGNLASQILDTTYRADSTKTLFGKVRISTLGIYIAPEFQYGQLAQQFTSLGSGSLMLSFNKKFDVGLNMSSNRGDFAPKDISSAQDLRLRTRTVGLKMAYNVAPYKLVYISIPLVIGGGTASIDSLDAVSNIPNGHHDIGNNRRNRSNNTSYMFVQPGVNADVNLFKYAKFFIGASYRINLKTRNGSDALVQLANGQLGGLIFQTGLKIGIFGYNIRKGNNN